MSSLAGINISDLENIATGRVSQLLSTLGGAYGAVQSAKANKKFEKNLNTRINDLQSAFDKASSTPFLQTDQGRSFLQTLGNQYDKQTDKIEGSAVVAGATPEAQIAAKESAQEGYGDALTKFAGYGTQYKDMKEREYNRRSDALQNFYLQYQLNKAGQWANLMNNAANLGQTGATTGAMAESPGMPSLADLNKDYQNQ